MTIRLSAHPRKSQELVLPAHSIGGLETDLHPERRAPQMKRVSSFAGLNGLLGLLLCLASVAITTPVLAEPEARPDQPLASASQEARAQALFDEVRCVVCQHESIADSPAGIAADMRRLVREEIASGASDDAVRADLVRRWGDFILFKPPVSPATWLLWFGPAAIVLLIGAVFLVRARRREPSTLPLSAEEEGKLAELLRSEDVRPDTDASSPHDRREAGTTIVPPPD